jgi:hypothetical protein
MKKFLNFKGNETLLSILPIALIILLISVTLVPVSGYDITLFIISTIFLIIGMELFTKGADRAMLPIGENIGANLSKSRKLIYFIICSLLFGFIIALAEPDLLVLAEQIIGINKWVFIIAAAIGVSIFMMIAVMRIIFQVKLSTILFISYSIVIVLMFFVPQSLLSMTLDSGGVTSGPISVPFILALGTGISAVRSSKNAKDESFGLIALTSIGPIIVTMILCLFVDPNIVVEREIIVQSTSPSFLSLFSDLGLNMVKNLYEIIIILAPIVLIFFVFNFRSLKLPKPRIIKIVIGLLYTYFGLTLFLTGASVGYLKIASIIGFNIGLNYEWLLIPLSIIFGLTIVFAEPALHVLCKKVEEITNGIIRKKVMMITLAIGVALSLVLAVCRVIFEINILYILAPCYLLMIVLLIFTPRIFTSIAFDSGGVAAGSMSSCFLLPFVIGVSLALGNDIMISAFGTIALVATLPILSIETLGLVYKIIKNSKQHKENKIRTANVEIIEFDMGEII